MKTVSKHNVSLDGHAHPATGDPANDTVKDQWSNLPADVSIHATTAKQPSGPVPRSFALKSLFWVMQLAVAGAAGFWLARQIGQGEDHRIELTVTPAPTTSAVVPVTVENVAIRDVARRIEAVGNLHGYDELTLKTKVSGRVAKIHHDFADRVAPGELLLEIDPTDAKLALEQAQKSLNSEMAKWGFHSVPAVNEDLTKLPTVVSAKLKLDWNQSQLTRLTTLKERGSVIAEEIEQARTNAMVAESDYNNQLQLARAGAATTQQKKADLDIAEQNLKETKIFVPLPTNLGSLRGEALKYTVTERLVTQGAWIAAGTDLFRLVIDQTLKLRLTVPEKHVGAVKESQSVEVFTISQSDPVLGTVTRIGPSVDPNTRTFQVEAEVPNDHAALKSGSFAKANIIVNSSSRAQTVPIAALVTYAGVHKIFLVEGQQVKELHVKLGQQTDQWVEITEPVLAKDAVVVTSGQSKLADGSTVRVRTADEPVANTAQLSGASGVAK